MDYVVHIKDRTPHKAIASTPYEKLIGSKPSLKHVRVFGCAAFVYEHDPKSKVHARAAPAVMLGCNDHSVYTVERLTDRKIINSVHVTFDEESFPKLEIRNRVAVVRSLSTLLPGHPQAILELKSSSHRMKKRTIQKLC